MASNSAATSKVSQPRNPGVPNLERAMTAVDVKYFAGGLSAERLLDATRLL
jgi:hypothetical protein